MPADWIEEVHPQYAANAPYWRLYYDAWRGGRYWLPDLYLHRHPRERTDEFASRRKRSFYFNFAEPIVKIHTSNIFRAHIVRDDLGMDVDNFLSDCDRRRTDFDVFMGKKSDYAKVFGHVHVLVDRPRFPDRLPSTKAVVSALKLDPYLVPILPFDFLDWEVDGDGTLLWCKVRERADFKGSPYGQRPTSMYNFKIWDRSGWTLFNEDGAQLAAGAHGLGIVPIQTVFYERTEDPLMGHSFLADIAPICKAIFNWCSLLDQIVYDQTFSILTMPDDGSVVLQEMQIGTSKALTYPAGGTGPTFISPDASQADMIGSRITDAIMRIREKAMIDEGGNDNVSEETRKYDFNLMNNALHSQGQHLQEAEEGIFRLRAMWRDEEFKGTVEYPSDYSITSLDHEIEAATKAMALDLGKTFEKEVKKRVAARLMPELPPALKKKIFDEIEKQVESLSTILKAQFGDDSDKEPPDDEDKEAA